RCEETAALETDVVDLREVRRRADDWNELRGRPPIGQSLRIGSRAIANLPPDEHHRRAVGLDRLGVLFGDVWPAQDLDKAFTAGKAADAHLRHVHAVRAELVDERFELIAEP